MNFALLGLDGPSAELAMAIEKNDEHRIVALYDVGANPDLLHLRLKIKPHSDSWESVLEDTAADAVIVARREDLDDQADRLRKLAQAGVSALVVHPSCESIVGYEIAMICRDTGCVMMPYIPAALHPSVDYLYEQVCHADRDPESGFEQLVFERTLPNRNRENVLRQFAVDVEIIRRMLGEIKQIAAMGAADDEQAFSSLSVQMRSSKHVLARWSISPAEDGSLGRLRLVGEKNSTNLLMTSPADAWTIVGNDPSQIMTFENVDLANAVLERFVRLMEGEAVRPQWTDACRDIEISEAIRESLRRQRTIDLHYGEHSEEATFMGLMSIGGCGLLILAPLLLVVAGVVEGLQIPVREHFLWRIWPLYLLAALAVFLMLQVFKLVFQKRSNDGV